MVSVDCGAVEARFVRPATSADLQVNPSLVVLDLDCSSIKPLFKKKKHCQGWSLMGSLARHRPQPFPPHKSSAPEFGDEGMHHFKKGTGEFLHAMGCHAVETGACTHVGGSPMRISRSSRFCSPCLMLLMFVLPPTLSACNRVLPCLVLAHPLTKSPLQ